MLASRPAFLEIHRAASLVWNKKDVANWVHVVVSQCFMLFLIFCCGVYTVSWPCAARFQCILDCLPWVMSSVVSYLPPTTNDWGHSAGLNRKERSRVSGKSSQYQLMTSCSAMECWYMNPYIRVESENMKGFQILHGMTQSEMIKMEWKG